jgi:iron(III) transport system substrate-binding protein
VRCATVRGRAGIALGVAVALVALAACGGSPTAGGPATVQESPAVRAVIHGAAGRTGQERTDYLLEQARKESAPLHLYTSYSEEVLSPLVERFEQAYGIHVEAFRAGPEAIVDRIQQETTAGYDGGADVVETRGFELYRLSQAGLISSFGGEFTDAVPEYGRAQDWTADRLNVIVPSWNTTAVPAGEHPTSWEDLADPRWKGRLAMEQLDDNWFQTLFEWMVSQGKSEQEVEDYFRRLAANSGVVKGHTQMQQMLVAGQYAVAVSSYTYITEQQKRAGAPVEWLPAVQPAVAQPNGVALARQAKNPASAALFYSWLLTDGQQVLADTGNTPATFPIDADVIAVDIEGYAAEAADWSRRYDELLKNAGA